MEEKWHFLTYCSYCTYHTLGIHDPFGTELAMIFSFHVGLTDSVMQRMHFFSVSVCSTSSSFTYVKII
jgi:hypothetical protein